jgi:hypothetical protein
MTAVELVTALRRRGVELVTDGARLGFRPAGSLTAEERAALIAAKAEVLSLLREEDSESAEAADGWADGAPDGPCRLCGSALAWVEEWPAAGEARWLCPRCMAQPAPSLVQVHATLTLEERERLCQEVRAGDPLARLVLRLVTEGTA